MPTYKHVLFATDLAEDSDNIAKKVTKLAELYEAKLSMVHVVEHLAAIAYSYMGSIEVEDQLVNEARAELKKMGDLMQVAEENRHLEVGHPKTEIIEVANRVGADLIIVGSHGPHGITALIGSTTNAIIHGASCDVLMVRAS